MIPAIELINVNKHYEGSPHAVKDISFSVQEGETLVLVGSSGCGKTTILKIINRLIEPSSGTIKINGKNILSEDPIKVRRSIGYVIQGIGLFSHMNIEENISLPLKLIGISVEEQRVRTTELLSLVGLEPDNFRNRYPDELSGGQQQRVGVARGLAAKPSIILMDEPFGALDAVTRELLQEELIRLKARIRKTIVFVTHDIFEAFTLADRIAVLHDGLVQQIGRKEEIISRPATEFVKELLVTPRKQLKEFREFL